jgi:hypothetical protein
MAQVPSHVDTSEVLGCRPLAQVAIHPRGAWWATVARSQGSMIALIALGRRPDPDPAQTPHFWESHAGTLQAQAGTLQAQAGTLQAGPVVQVPVATSGALLAVTGEDLALVGYRLHGVALTAGQVILRMPRGEVKTALLGRGWHGVLGTAPSPFTIVLVNGDTWRLEVFWIDKRRAKAVVRALAA